MYREKYERALAIVAVKDAAARALELGADTGLVNQAINEAFALFNKEA